MLDEMPVSGAEAQVSTAETQQTVDTGASETQTPVEQAPVTAEERKYSKQEVIDMMKRRVARSHNAFFKRYGVENLEALDGLFENSKKFGEMNEEFGKIQLRNSELARENAFLRNNVNPDKYDDIIAHFKGNDIEFSEEELLKALTNHPEWLKQTVPQTTIKSLGAEAHTMPKADEASLAGKLLGVKL